MVTGSMLERQAGLSSGVHTTGHLMLFFSFVFALYFIVGRDKKKTHNVLMALLLLGSLFCMYKTYTRTTLLGGLVFWFSYIWFVKRKWFVPFLALLLLVSVLKYNDIHSMVIQKGYQKQTVDLNSASSGRESLWRHNLKLFGELPIESKLLGVGLGQETKPVPGRNVMWAGSHNDYLSLLVTTGALGLMQYLILYATLLLNTISSRCSRDLRFFVFCVMGSVLLMNLVSNSYIVRTQMAQMFWFLIGLVFACWVNNPKSQAAVAPIGMQLNLEGN
jgi:O-antigen ligase